MTEKADIAVIGLGVMGQNLALNIESKGFKVVGYDHDAGKANAFAEHRAKGKRISIEPRLDRLAAQLKVPRKALLMVPAGKPVDELLESLALFLDKGDIVIDGGNSFFLDTQGRCQKAEETGLLFIGTGVSGGEEGALKGPSIMPGGSPAAWPEVKPILTAIAAKADDGAPCCEWIGVGGAGHFVKMVHNGIEYADMQLIGEAYFVMSRLLGMQEHEMADVFDAWSHDDLQSYLVEITRDILREIDSETGEPMIRKIKDTAGQKGTGKWTSQVSLDLGVAAPTIAESVFARCMSAAREERIQTSALYSWPTMPASDKVQALDDVRQALLASKICAYAQGFRLLREADREHGWGLNLASITAIWRAGCIIRARILEPIRQAFLDQPDLANLLQSAQFASTLHMAQEGWRRTVSACVLEGVPVPALASALSYFDGCRSARLPANLLQAQRDYFGAHTFERLDKPGSFHHVWARSRSKTES